jgi:hypothetical protein
MRDLRIAIRALRATPIVTAVAVLSLALAIGASTAILSPVDTLLTAHSAGSGPAAIGVGVGR